MGKDLEALKLTFIREKELLDLIGVGRTTLNRWVKQGHFPIPTTIGPRTKVWVRTTVEAWIRERRLAA